MTASNAAMYHCIVDGFSYLFQDRVVKVVRQSKLKKKKNKKRGLWIWEGGGVMNMKGGDNL